MICSNEDFLDDLIGTMIIRKSMDILKILEEKSKEYPGILIHGFERALILRNVFSDCIPAEYFFKRIEKNDIIEVRPEKLDMNKLLKFLEKSSYEEYISQSELEKLYCWIFYSINLDINSLIVLLTKTHGDTNFSIEYIYDCMIRRPDICIFKFYESGEMTKESHS